MNTNRFKWLKAGRRNNGLLLLATSEERIQMAAETHIKRGLTSKELGFVGVLLNEKLEQLLEDENSIIAQAIHEAVELEVRK